MVLACSWLLSSANVGSHLATVAGSSNLIFELIAAGEVGGVDTAKIAYVEKNDAAAVLVEKSEAAIGVEHFQASRRHWLELL
jgi:ethanolamine transporter EutH